MGKYIVAFIIAWLLFNVAILVWPIVYRMVKDRKEEEGAEVEYSEDI